MLKIIGIIAVVGLCLVGLCSIVMVVFAVPWGNVVHVSIEDAELIETQENHIVVDLTTDLDFMGLEGTRWSRVVYLLYSVDSSLDLQGGGVRAQGRDFENISSDRPYFAELVSRTLKQGETTSRWTIEVGREEGSADDLPPYNLKDGKEHSVTVEVYGADYVGGYVTSRPITLKIPSTKQK